MEKHVLLYVFSFKRFFTCTMTNFLIIVNMDYLVLSIPVEKIKMFDFAPELDILRGLVLSYVGVSKTVLLVITTSVVTTLVGLFGN